MAPDEWGAEHLDRTDTAWPVCECGHATDTEALVCSREILSDMGRTAYETHRRMTGGASWEALDADAREPWMHVALAVRTGVVLG